MTCREEKGKNEGRERGEGKEAEKEKGEREGSWEELQAHDGHAPGA